MNANIFDNNEDLPSPEEGQQPPSVFEDLQNPLQSSIAVAYYRFKAWPEEEGGRLGAIFRAGERHAGELAEEQEQKMEELVKMLVDVSYSKLELKSIFLQEYEKLVERCLFSQKSTVANLLAEGLKQNTRFLELHPDP
jgi:hypothetical protein